MVWSAGGDGTARPVRTFLRIPRNARWGGTAAGGGAITSQGLWLQSRDLWVTYDGGKNARLSIGLVARRTGATAPTVRYVALCVLLGSS